MEILTNQHRSIFARLLIMMILLTSIAAPPSSVAAQDDFIRGDCLMDGEINLGDLVWMWCVFCDPGPAQCYDACDINDDGLHSISDAVFLTSYLFEDGPTPLAPFPACGPDTTADGLTCVNYQ